MLRVSSTRGGAGIPSVALLLQPGLQCLGWQTWQGPQSTGPGCQWPVPKRLCSFMRGCGAAGRPSIHTLNQGQLLPPSLAKAPQSLRLQESTSSDYLFTSEHLMGLQILRQISFQMIAPAMSFIWKSHCISLQLANKCAVFSMNFW